MITWTIKIAGIDRTVLVKPATGAPRYVIVACHGHNMRAVDYAKRFPAQPDVVWLFPQGLVDDLGEEGWIRLDATAKFTRYNAQGTEDFELVEAALARVTVQWGPLIPCAVGFSGGTGFERHWLAKRTPWPFLIFCPTKNTMQEDEVVDGAYAPHPGNTLPPICFILGAKDTKTAQIPPKLTYEQAIEAYSRAFGATEVLPRKTVSGRVYRSYTNRDYAFVMAAGGHSTEDADVADILKFIRTHGG